MKKPRHFRFSWYNIKKLSEDDYDKKYNEAYQSNKKTYFKKVLHIGWLVDLNNGDSYYGLEWANTWTYTRLLWETPKHIYWIIFRDSYFFDRKGKWKFKIMKTENDHISCG